MANILGIGGYSHDASATLLQDGVVLAAAEEERFTRQKHQGGWPESAIEFCLSSAGLSKTDIDHIAFYWNPWGFDSFRSYARRLLHFPRHPIFTSGFLLQNTRDTAMYAFQLRRLRAQSGGRAKIHYINHHDTHGAVFFSSPFEESAVLTIDSRGEWATSVWYHGSGNRLKKIRQINLPNSVGVICLAVTNYLGFRTGDEYKVMGLAAYGEPKYVDHFRRLYKLKSDGTYKVDASWFKVQHSPGRYAGYVSDRFLKLFGEPRQAESEISDRHRDIAASLQQILQEIVFHMLRGLHQATGCANVCLSGGVAQNSLMIGRIRDETPFKNVFLHSASGDNGTSMGAAQWVNHQLLDGPRREPFSSSYLGPAYTEREIEESLIESRFRYERPECIATATAEEIAAGHIVGWFQGRMEWGARALGNRSILADVTNPNMTDIVNRQVKHREDFRPFAPACTEERAAEFFEIDEPSPYMLKVVPAKDSAKERMPAIVHVDGTARLQTVNNEQNPLFYRLLQAVQQTCGIPCVLNTSFNVRGEPIVCRPVDAIRCWAATGIDTLVMGPFLLRKK